MESIYREPTEKLLWCHHTSESSPYASTSGVLHPARMAAVPIERSVQFSLELQLSRVQVEECINTLERPFIVVSKRRGIARIMQIFADALGPHEVPAAIYSLILNFSKPSSKLPHISAQLKEEAKGILVILRDLLSAPGDLDISALLTSKVDSDCLSAKKILFHRLVSDAHIQLLPEVWSLCKKLGCLRCVLRASAATIELFGSDSFESFWCNLQGQWPVVKVCAFDDLKKSNVLVYLLNN